MGRAHQIKLAFAVAVALLAFWIPASAETFSDAQRGVTLQVPDGYTVVTAETLDEQAEYLETLGHSVDSFGTYFSKDGLLLFAASADGDRQVQLKCVQTDFTAEIGDLSLLDDTKAREVASKIISDTTKATWDLFEFSGMKLFEIRTSTADSGGAFCTVQYVTIRNGSLYTLACYSAGENLAQADLDAAAEMLSGFRIQQQKQKFSVFDAESIFLTALICLAILAALGVMGFIVYSFFKDAKRKRDENDVSEYVKIKRRKF